jgi:hypothetical protein
MLCGTAAQLSVSSWVMSSGGSSDWQMWRPASTKTMGHGLLSPPKDAKVGLESTIKILQWFPSSQNGLAETVLLEYPRLKPAWTVHGRHSHGLAKQHVCADTAQAVSKGPPISKACARYQLCSSSPLLFVLVVSDAAETH